MLKKRHKINVLVCLLNSCGVKIFWQEWKLIGKKTFCNGHEENCVKSKRMHRMKEWVWLVQVNLALTSGHCLSQKSVLQNMQWDAKIFTLSTPENSIGVFIYTRSLRVMDAIMCQLLKNNLQTFGHVPRFAVSQILPHALMLSYND